MTGFPWTLNPSCLTTVSFQKFINYKSGVPTPALVSMKVFAHVFFLWFVVILYTCLYVSLIFASVVCPGTPTSLKIKEELLIFKFIAVRIEWLCASNLHARPETRSAQNFKFDVVSFFYFCFRYSCFSVTSKKSLLNPLSWNIPLIFY